MKKILVLIILTLILFTFKGTRIFSFDGQLEQSLVLDQNNFVKVKLGAQHTIALSEDGSVFTWGRNDYGQLGNGSVSYLGYPYPIDITNNFFLNTDENIVDVMTGFHTSAAVTNLGRLFIWGKNGQGEIGDGTNEDKMLPTDITESFSFNEEESILQVSLGRNSSGLLTSQGRVFTWGSNFDGQLGNGTTVISNEPIEITSQFILQGDEEVIQIEMNASYSMALTSKGSVFAWGQGTAGQFGDGEYNEELNLKPVDITDILNLNLDEVVESLSASNIHCGVITSEQRVILWGYGGNGQIGAGSSNNRYTPTDISSQFSFYEGEKIQSLTLGASSSALLTNIGRIFTWGSNESGQLGDGTFYNRYGPIEVTKWMPLEKHETISLISLSTGSGDHAHSAIITSNGNLYLWGYNSSGQLGTGILADFYADSSTHYSTVPNPAAFGDISIYPGSTAINDGIIAYDGTGRNSLALLESGKLYFWGYNHDGIFVKNKDEIQNRPIEITSLIPLDSNEKITNIEKGNYHAAITTSNNRLLIWGKNIWGQIGDGSDFNQYKVYRPIDVTSALNLSEGELIEDMDLGYHSVLLTSKGRVLTWGSNHQGQLGDGTTENKNLPVDITSMFNLDLDETIIEIIAGDHNSAAITSNGRIFTWGNNTYGQLGDGTTTDQSSPVDITNQFAFNENETIMSIILSSTNTVALTSKGRVFTWGDNQYGQLGNGERTSYRTPHSVPIDVTNSFLLDVGESIIKVDIGNFSSMALTSSNRLFTWGSNNYGQLGDGTINDSDIPIDISENYTLKSDEDIIEIYAKGSFSAFLTSSGRLLNWGANYGGQLGNATEINLLIPDEQKKIYSSYKGIQYLDAHSIQNYALDKLNLSIYLFDDYSSQLQSVVVNGTTYTEFESSFGMINISIPNHRTLGDVVTFTVDQMTFKDGITFYPQFNNTVSTLLTEDIFSPEIEFDYDKILYIEEGLGHDSLIAAKAIDDTGEILEVTIESDIDWTTPGVYLVNYFSIDEHNNTNRRKRVVYVFPDLKTRQEEYYGITFNNFYDQINSQTTTIRDPFVTYLDNDYLSIDAYVLSELEYFWNTLTYSFESDSFLIIGSKGIYIEDNEPPIFDTIEEQIIEAGVSDIDWSTYVTNQTDNSESTLTASEVEDNVDYSSPGSYTVIVTLVDESNNETSQEFYVTVVDTTAPELSLNPMDTTVPINAVLEETGVTINDFSTTTMIIDSDLNLTAAGQYTINYTVTDSSGNVSIIERIIHVYEPEPEIQFYLEDALTTIEVGSTFEDSGCTSTINGETLACAVKNNLVNTAIAGVYTITYSVEYNGETYTYNRYVFVYDVSNNGVQTLYYRKEQEEGVIL